MTDLRFFAQRVAPKQVPPGRSVGLLLAKPFILDPCKWFNGVYLSTWPNSRGLMLIHLFQLREIHENTALSATAVQEGENHEVQRLEESRNSENNAKKYFSQKKVFFRDLKTTANTSFPA